MTEDQMIEEAMARALMRPILNELDADVAYYLAQVRAEMPTARDRWEATLPDEWDTHKLGGVTPSGIGVCAEDCEACKFRFALKTMPLTVWIGSRATLDDEPLFVVKSKRLAEQLRDTDWSDTPIIITELEVTL
jgi:hypothetical protein